MVKPLAIAVMGPTASGKSALALALAEHFAAELISVDSAQIFCGLDIGSAKPTVAEQKKIKHHLIDIRDPAELYSAANFCRDASSLIKQMCNERKIPILVGGTMLYFKALLEGLSDIPTSDAATRAEIEAEARELGWPAMHNKLAAVDPDCAASLHPNHSQRIGRALEVFRMSGKTISEWRKIKTPGLLDQYQWIQIALLPTDRGKLHARIETRFDQMLDDGLVNEVELLYKRGDLSLENASIRAVGYRQVWEYLQGKISYAEMREKGIAATRQLAKRQFTWLRSWPNLCCVHIENGQGEELTSKQIVKNALNFLP